MPYYDASGQAYPNKSQRIAASQTTAQLSAINDSCPGRDYLERVVVTAASTLGGAVTVFDGTVAILTHNAQVTGYLGPNVYTYEFGTVSTTTKGFNITTGASVSCLAVGRW